MSHTIDVLEEENRKLLEELEDVHRANKSLSDEKEKNRQEYIELYKKLEAIRAKWKEQPSYYDETDHYEWELGFEKVLGE